jgi:hypothetical protein
LSGDRFDLADGFRQFVNIFLSPSEDQSIAIVDRLNLNRTTDPPNGLRDRLLRVSLVPRSMRHPARAVRRRQQDDQKEKAEAKP